MQRIQIFKGNPLGLKIFPKTIPDFVIRIHCNVCLSLFAYRCKYMCTVCIYKIYYSQLITKGKSVCVCKFNCYTLSRCTVGLCIFYFLFFSICIVTPINGFSVDSIAVINLCANLKRNIRECSAFQLPKVA